MDGAPGRRRTLAIIALTALTTLGCGGSSASPATASHTSEGVAEIPGPPRPWPALSRAERAQHMSAQVLPRMRELFAAYDGERYADFDCTTCHGDDARERGFAMPSPSLLPLHPTGSEGQHQTVRDHPEGVRFMYGRVLPMMQSLLAAPPFDETTREGFTCYACHPHAADDAPLATR
ncbi:MAG: hypothetical protein M3Y87_16610 [Myxococcota bacterium]|nr:hypothetical protein [Myxococcota bacterium]